VKMRFYFKRPPRSDDFAKSFAAVDSFGPAKWNGIDPSGKTHGKRFQVWLRLLRLFFTGTFACRVRPS
jgi:hypothetical protein